MTSGKIVEIRVDYAGTTLVGDHAGGASVLNVADVIDFSEDGGRLSIDGGAEYDFTATDEDSLTITLATPLADPVDDDTPLLLVPLSPEVFASVSLDEESGEVIEGVVVPHHLVPLLAEGIRDPETAESVELEALGSGEWAIKNILGKVTQIDSEIRLPHATDPFDLVLKDGDIYYESQTSGAVPGGVRFNSGLLMVGVGDLSDPDNLLPTSFLVLADTQASLDTHGHIGIGGDTIRIASKTPQNYPDSAVTIKDVVAPVDPHDAATKAYVDANAGGGGSAVEYVTVMLDSGDQSIANGTGSLKVIQWQTTQDSEGLTWDHSAHRFVADVDSAGLFEVSANIAWRGATGGTRYLTVCVNGTEVNQARMNPPSSGVFTQHLVSMPIRLGAGDYIDFQVAQSSGSALNLVGNGDYLTKATIKRIGD